VRALTGTDPDRLKEEKERGITIDLGFAHAALGEGLAPIEGNVCQGCFSSITPNDRSRLISALELVVCRSCSRIIYLPEVLQASPT